MAKDKHNHDVKVGETVHVVGEFKVKSVGDGEHLVLESAGGHTVECDACCVEHCEDNPHGLNKASSEVSEAARRGFEGK